MLTLLGWSALFSEGASASNPDIDGQRPVFAWPVYSDRSPSVLPIVSGGSWESTLPLAHLQDRRLSRPARSTNALGASTRFDIDLEAVRAVGVLALPKHNLSTSATVTWLGSLTSNFSSLVFNTQPIDAWPAGTTPEDMAGINAAIVTVLPEDKSVRYLRCTISDVNNAAGYVELGRVIVAGAWRPSAFMTVGAKLGLESASERIVSDGGAALYLTKPMRRYWDFSLSLIEEAETFAQAWHMMRQLGSVGQLFFVYAPSEAFLHERSFLCVMRDLSPVEFPFAHFRSVAFRLVEEL